MRKLDMDELNRISSEQFKQEANENVVVVLDNVRSMNNVGSLFRTADAFKVSKIYLCGVTATPPHREIHKTALGATESVNWEYYKETNEAILVLKTLNYQIIAVEQTTQSVYLHNFEASKNRKYAFIFGNEAFGVADEVLPLCDIALEIPQFGTKHSFNIVVSAGIVLWHYAYLAALTSDK
ncbi:MAG: TrmH family RNA methyltransferase [Cytophagales bacterium]|nr:MAG: TrmH family RNA methyltransferase [Cytophagales bacterium]